MRTSSQLTKVEQCEHHSHANITQTTDFIVRAAAQKDVIMRILKGEPIDDIQGEINSILVNRNCAWENREQKNANLILMQKRIERFLAFEQNRDHDFPDGYDTTVDFFGEEVKAVPDYFVHDGNTTYVCKVTTSRFKSEKEDMERNEIYALGLCGEKLFPGQEIRVQYLHLGDKDSKTEMSAISKPYTDSKANKISELAFDEKAKEFYIAKHQQELEGGGCTKEDCAGCSMNNICHYEEPPISVDVQKTVKPISEIRLTHAQQQVVEYEQGIARINAGAGAGKTLVVAMRIVELLKKGYEPEDICLLTFTKAGAEEMTARVIQYCAANELLIDPARLTSTTFNSFCNDLIKDHYEELGYTEQPRVMPDETRSGIINRLIDQYPHIEEWNYATISSGKFSKYNKSALNSAKQLFAEIKKEGYTRYENPYDDKLSPVSLDLLFTMYDDYENVLKRRNFIEFDDQILETFRLLELHPTIFDEKGYRHIIVDEFQDTDLPQIQLLNKINDTASFLSFMAVGDDSQSIFAFRHTSPKYMINFADYFGRFDDFNLIENHRSNGNTIKFANKVNALVESRVDKDLIATKADGIEPTIQGFSSQKSEYEWIGNQIKHKIEEEGRVPSDIACLFSTRDEAKKMASVLTELGIPSVLMNPIPFKENSRVAALCTFYDAFVNGTTRGLLDYQNVLVHGALKGAKAADLEEIENNFVAELRTQPRTLTKFKEYAKALDVNEVDECYQAFLEKVDFCRDIDELAEFFRDFKLYGDDSCYKREGQYEGVCLTTVHSAKGLEWDITYLSLSQFDKETYHNNYSKFRESGEKDEVARKWFVGATRAREELIMTGQYVLKFNQKNGFTYNDYVQEAYNLLGRAYDFNAVNFWQTNENEKKEMLSKSISSLNLNLGRKHEGGDVKPKDDVMSRYRMPVTQTTAQLQNGTDGQAVPDANRLTARGAAIANTQRQEPQNTQTQENTNEEIELA